MIEIEIYEVDGLIRGFEVEGHSEYAEHGKDIVCAAISILSQTTLFTLLEDYGPHCSYSKADGYLEVEILDVDKLDELQLLFKAFKLGVLNVAEQFPKYVKLNLC